MPSRRSFLETTLGSAAASLLPTTASAAGLHEHSCSLSAGKSAHELANDETFWAQAMTAFSVDRTLINLNNGGVSPTPKTVLQATQEYMDAVNKAPHYVLNQVLLPRLETVRAALARTFGVTADELALTRNTSEALQIVQLGLPMKSGDEVIITTQDYPRMITAWEQRARREGIVLKKISYPAPLLRPTEFIERITAAVTPRTRVIHCSHVCFATGEILPVRELCRWAREHGILTMVDGAHAFAQFPFTYADVECDFYATSLHKWLYAPLGNGFLFMRREHIKSVWPLMAAAPDKDGDIRKFEEIGTSQLGLRAAVGEALAFNEALDASLVATSKPFARKAERLRSLNQRWTARLQGYSTVKFLTTITRPEASCGLVLMNIDGMDIGKMAEYLLRKHHIIVAQIVWAELRGIRITPNIYTRSSEIDLFADIMERAARGEVPEIKT
jgi:selenocysteine lyase/cysteine desulfurase